MFICSKTKMIFMKFSLHRRSEQNAPFYVKIKNQEFEINLIDPKRLRGSSAASELADGIAEIKTAMPGKLVRVLVELGAEIKKGESRFGCRSDENAKRDEIAERRNRQRNSL